ncbi:MaoC/PaaZ C-terminal domain-containing protein [Noviherbaspirillum sedimenti]|uniref:Dehydratase n=1 Tax=Noviherbaspirillum sedimenti TaxID=2320865 RepID=A0A3A3G462_9BURK|nr:MaoC/PaaZ C-terminal domain-containing protein [Noviherbaspirillum sedimenti]RJG03277.1 dehydratase [Noviherbaspirillum sedimenti]
MILENVTVGTELPPLQLEPISRRTLALFAGGSGDHQPVHIDIDVAKARGRGDVIAHGMLSMAYLGRLLTNWIPQERIRSFKARFAAVAPVYGEPRCTGRVVAVENGLATLDLTVALADGTVTVRGEAIVDITPGTEKSCGSPNAAR